MHGPPRFGKSIIVGQRLIPWLLMYNPAWRCPLLTYNVDHSTEFGEVIRDLMKSEDFKSVAPVGAHLEREDCSAKGFKTLARADKKDGDYSFRALGFQTGFTGKGADCCIVDDPYASPEDARSEAINGKTIRTYQQQVKLRVNADSPLVMMYHRYHEVDLGAVLLEEGGWRHLRFPCEFDAKDNEDGSDITGRADGEFLSDLWSKEHLLSIKEDDPETWNSMYQGRPKSAKGGYIQETDFQLINSWEVPKLDYLYRGYDTATSVKEQGHLTASAKIGVDPSLNIYIFDVRWWKKEYPDTKADIKATAIEDGHLVPIGIENKMAGMALVQDLLREPELSRHQIWEVNAPGDKKQKAGGWVSRGRQGRLFIVKPDKVDLTAKAGEKGSGWVRPFINICKRFDGLGLDVDDPVDAMSIAYHMVQTLMGGAQPDEQDSRPKPNTEAYYDALDRRASGDDWEDDEDDD